MRHRLGSVRIRTTLAAAVIVAAALSVAAVGLVSILRATMVSNIDAALSLRASDIGAITEGGTLPDAVAIEGEQDAFVQIVNPAGDVLVSSRNVEGEPRITNASSGTSLEVTNSPVDVGSFRVHVQETAAPNRLTVIVGRSLEDVNTTIRVATVWLLFGVPALVLLVAAITWVVVGRALKPVDDIRAEVADIGGSDLDRRVPTPPTDDEIGRLAATMNQMLDRLESASERQKRFVSDASHELRTPIATVRHELDVARSSPRIDIDGLIEDIDEENRRMQHLVDDLLLLAREDQAHRDAQQAVNEHAIVDLDELALIEAHRRRATNTVIDSTNLAPAPTNGDERQLARVIANLVDNAVRHARTAVRIETATEQDRVVLIIDDDGPGVAPPDRQRIFERFTRADDDRARTGSGNSGGAGLGLAIVHDLIANHHGTVEVTDSTDLGGARFTVNLPRADNHT